MRKLSFKKRLLAFYLALSVIPIIGISAFIYWKYSRALLDQARTSTEDTINLVCDEIDDLFDTAWSMCTAVSDDINMQKFLRRQFGSLSEQYSTDLEGSMELAGYTAYRDEIFGLYVLGANGGQYKSNSYSFQAGDQREASWYNSIIESGQPLWFVPHNGSFVVKGSQSDRFISLGLPVVDKASGRKSGVVVADIDERVIAGKIRYGIYNGVIFILDENGTVIFQGGEEADSIDSAQVAAKLHGWVPEQAAAAEGASSIVPDDDYLIICRQLGKTQWKIAGIVDKKLITQTNQSITYSIGMLLILVTVLALFVAAFISESISRPVRQLVQLMEKVEAGDLTVRAPDLGGDELGHLGNSFNQMLSQTQLLMNRIYEEQKKLRSSELRALQSQIQPHFLYNCLDSITWLLRMEKNQEAEQMLTSLSSLFRVSLSKGREIISVEDEILHVTSYLRIQNIIYSKKFSYEICCEKTLYPYKTLKLLLQPLVENSISHARPKKGEKVHIQVSVYEEDDCLTLSVRDHSRGLTAQEVSAIQNRLSQPAAEDGRKNGYGLYNVNERIHVLLGKDYGIHLSSSYGEGTHVFIRIPKVKGEEEFVQGNSM